MDRRFFTKTAGVSVIGVLAGCVSPDDEEEDGPDDSAREDQPDETADEDVGDEADTDESGEEETDDDEEEEVDEDPGEEEVDEDPEEEEVDEDPEEEEVDEDPEEEEVDDDEDPEEEEADDDAAPDDEPPELEGEVELDADLEGILEVDHEFIWESYEGSHLCNINVEMENTSTSSELYYQGIGMITDGDGNHLSSDSARFSLGPDNSLEHTFSLDQCAEATTYRVEIEADQIVEE